MDSKTARSGNFFAGIFAAAIMISAFLLFHLEPLFARMLLPLAGGSPAVWNTAMVCFQSLLLGGYFYAHLLQKIKKLNHQLYLHLALVVSALAVMPIHVNAGVADRFSENSVLVTVTSLFASVGLPFFILSATGPLLQAWFSRSSVLSGTHTYALYSASNFGSLCGLLCYPLLLEPFTGIFLQVRFWWAGFVVFVVILGTITFILQRRTDFSEAAPQLEVAPAAEVQVRPWAQRARWMLYAAIPSSLMLAITTDSTTRIAPLPLLWVLPLSLYLITFIFAFSERSLFTKPLAANILRWLFILTMISAAVTSGLHIQLSPVNQIVFYSVLFFVVALTAHTALYASRPPLARLTEYYLYISLGSVIAGLCNVLIAPRIFTDVHELAISLLLAAWFFAPEATGGGLRGIKRLSTVFIVMLAALLIDAVVVHLHKSSDTTQNGLMMLLLAVMLLWVSDRRKAFTVSLTIIYLAGNALPIISGSTLYQERNFFGVKTVLRSVDGRQMWMVHSGTIHGAEMLDPREACSPTIYFAPSSAIGQFFTGGSAQGIRSIAVIGLGAGTLAGYIRPGVAWTFYEIDPAMRDIAQNDAYFHFLNRCGHHPPVVIGDGRLALARTNETYDLMIFDAFSSDQIPVHLITREAVQSYLRRLHGDGYLAFNITNRLFDFAPVFANMATEFGLTAVVGRHVPNAVEAGKGAVASRWVFMARDPQRVRSLVTNSDWRMLPAHGNIPLWTDDYSSIIRLMNAHL